MWCLGFHASTPAEYAEAIVKILQMPEAELQQMRQRVRQSVLERFSVPAFEKLWLQAYRELQAKQ